MDSGHTHTRIHKFRWKWRCWRLGQVWTPWKDHESWQDEQLCWRRRLDIYTLSRAMADFQIFHSRSNYWETGPVYKISVTKAPSLGFHKAFSARVQINIGYTQKNVYLLTGTARISTKLCMNALTSNKQIIFLCAFVPPDILTYDVDFV